MKLAAIDPAGLSDLDKTSRELLIRRLTDDQEAAEFKTWEMPVNQMGGIYATYPQLVAELSFTTVKDYDDWIARLHAIPKAFDQVTANMSIGMEDKRVPPKYLLEKTLEQVKQLATQKPEDSPLALPLKKFPASDLRRRPGTHQDRNARGNHQGSPSCILALRTFSRGQPTSPPAAQIPVSPHCPTARSTTSS